MKPEDMSDTMLSSAKPNGNTKKITEKPSEEGFLSGSIVKKNEFSLILGGALVLTLVVFFFFFNFSGSKPDTPQTDVKTVAVAELEERIAKMEAAVVQKESLDISKTNEAGTDKTRVDAMDARVTRLETAFSVKFDSLIERMGKMEHAIAQIKSNPPASAEVLPPPEKPKTVTPVKSSVKKEKAGSLFHTVSKGETLYSISKKYKTTVAALRKLNNLSNDASIYPGNNILVR